MVLIAIKLNKSNIYDGCLAYMKQYLTSELPPGQKWSRNGIQDIIGNEQVINLYNSPYNDPPSYFKIYFDRYIIKPISYSLM